MTTAIPTTAAELEEMLGDGEKMKGVFTDKARFKEFITNYGKAALEKDGSIATQVRDETQRAMAEFLKTNKEELDNRLDLNPMDRVLMARKKNAIYNKRAPGVALDNDFQDPAEFFQAIWHRSESLRNYKDLAPKRQKAFDVMNSFG
jgi:hypothetical protein